MAWLELLFHKCSRQGEDWNDHLCCGGLLCASHRNGNQSLSPGHPCSLNIEGFLSKGLMKAASFNMQEKGATFLRGSNSIFVLGKGWCCQGTTSKIQILIKHTSDFLTLSDWNTCSVRNEKTLGACPEWLRLLAVWRSKQLYSLPWLCNLNAHAKEKYQKVTLFLPTAGATKLQEQFRCLHVDSLCHIRHCRVANGDDSTLNHFPGIFYMFHLILVKEAKNEIDGMVTSAAKAHIMD